MAALELAVGSIWVDRCTPLEGELERFPKP
jgi:hypothetical protein